MSESAGRHTGHRVDSAQCQHDQDQPEDNAPSSVAAEELLFRHSQDRPMLPVIYITLGNTTHEPAVPLPCLDEHVHMGHDAPKSRSSCVSTLTCKDTSDTAVSHRTAVRCSFCGAAGSSCTQSQ